MNIVALIPARANSQRVPSKNTRLLGGKPLVTWTVEAAHLSGIFDRILVCSDDPAALAHGLAAGAECISRQPSADDERDIDWIRPVLNGLGQRPLLFAILRPTSPFRDVLKLRDAYAYLRNCAGAADSLRAVRPVTEHPGKMWTWDGGGHPMKPYVNQHHPDGTPWHSSPTQSLPKVYVQTSSLEIAWTRNVECFDTISGRKVVPWVVDEWDGFSIDYPSDWEKAETHAADLAALARV